ncbi:MAG: glycogen/starch synthase [Marinilabiliales bacterium]
MEKTKVLFVSQEITPYVRETRISKIGRNLPQGIQERGREIRTFMPRYGLINERRNQLHEVIRLSGMNLIINDTDHPLIIKVASIQSARMQIYFIDNEDFFARKSMLYDKNGDLFPDNDERAIFFARGVLETVKKLRWSPDIVHCHGWFTGLVPLYLKKAFREDPLYHNSKVVYSVYNDGFKGSLNKSFIKKIVIDGIQEEDISIVKKPDYLNISKLAINMADGIIFADEELNKDVVKHCQASNKPILEYVDDNSYIDAYNTFYDKVLEFNYVENK